MTHIKDKNPSKSDLLEKGVKECFRSVINPKDNIDEHCVVFLATNNIALKGSDMVIKFIVLVGWDGNRFNEEPSRKRGYFIETYGSGPWFLNNDQHVKEFNEIILLESI